MNETTPRSVQDQDPIKLTKRGKQAMAVGSMVLAIGAGFSAGKIFEAGASNEIVPQVNSKEYSDLAAQSADIARTPEDKVFVKGINGSLSEYPINIINNNPAAQKFLTLSPDQKASVEASALNTARTDTYAIVGRDIDHDGDLDAIVVADSLN